MSAKKLVRDLTGLSVGSKVWWFGRDRWSPDTFAGTANGRWWEQEIVDENRSFWIVGPYKRRLPKKIYEGDRRGDSFAVLRGYYAFSENEKTLYDWIRNSRHTVRRAFDEASPELIYEIAGLLGIDRPELPGGLS